MTHDLALQYMITGLKYLILSNGFTWDYMYGHAQRFEIHIFKCYI